MRRPPKKEEEGREWREAKAINGGGVAPPRLIQSGKMAQHRSRVSTRIVAVAAALVLLVLAFNGGAEARRKPNCRLKCYRYRRT